MPQRPHVIDQLISAKAIAARVEVLAGEISAYVIEVKSAAKAK